jgi:hypothetical protein
LEKQLQSWTPRGPSAKIDWGRRPATATARPEWTGASRWLAPAAVCLLLSVALLRRENEPRTFAGNQPLVALIFSNELVASYRPGYSSLNDQNLLSATFEWTNLRGSPSSIGPMSPKHSTN